MTVLVTGHGPPVTLVAHGLGATIAETRALVGGVPGTKVLPEARGHGGAAPPHRPGYAELAADLLAVADDHAASQALGVSMGAHALLRLLSAQPDRFDRLVLFLPAALDRPVRRTPALAAALATGDRGAVLSVVRDELGASTPAAVAYAEARATALLAMPALPALLSALAEDAPVPDRAALGAVTAHVLVIGQEGDPLHPAQVARELAAALPRSRLVVFGRPGAVFHERARFRSLVVGHLTGT